MKRLIFVLVVLLSAICYPLSAAYAQAVSSTELINNAKQYDGRTITYAGEAIGEVMPRGDFAWVNISDGENAIGIWIHKELAKEINYAGTYKTKGDWVEVIGTFQQACPAHGGDLDIHAQALRKITPGRLVKERLNTDKRTLALVLLGVLALIWILSRLKRK
ncbi:MAG: DNA-binding protein [Candidatus Omnitrophota bacterium]